jgi:putative transposon-encoded protein
MAAPKIEKGMKEIGKKKANRDKYRKAKFGLFGVEMIEKEVRPKGNSGRIYLPANWVGKIVKIVRVD